jgi:iron complex outermembrane recepter protein
MSKTQQSIAVVLSLSALVSAGSYAATNQTIEDDIIHESDPLDPPIPQVLTPVRLKQPRTEVPASVTVIDRQLIEATGVREIPELLRHVPGMVAAARSGWDYVVSYHGTNRRNSRRMQVLIDGRSVYQAGLATIEWSDIPLAMEDIERIEITRGPNTAAYGANAFLGIINIITRHPDDSARLRVKTTQGTDGIEDYYASTSGNLADSSYRLTVAKRQDNGFDRRDDDSMRDDSKNPFFINGRWLLASSDSWNLGLQFGYKDGDKTEDLNGIDISAPDQDVRDYFVSINTEVFLSENNSLKAQFDYSRTRYINESRTCQDFGIIVCGDINDNTENSRIDFDLQNTWLGGKNWKLVGGTHIQRETVHSRTFYNGTVDRTNYQLFANYEYRFLPNWSATIAGSGEKQSDGGTNFSPRLALLFMPNDNHTFRLVYSEAIRTPDFHENNLDYKYRATNITPPGILPEPFIQVMKKSKGNLQEEHIRSREFGYYSLWLNRMLELDIKVFNDDLYDLISENLANMDINPSNTTYLNQTGYEIETNFHATSRLRLHANFAQINSYSVTTGNKTNASNERSLTPHHVGSAGAIYNFDRGITLSSFYYYAYPVNDTKLSRWDSRLAKQIPVGRANLTVSANVEHYFSKYSNYFHDNLYDSPNRVYVSADITF